MIFPLPKTDKAAALNAATGLKAFGAPRDNGDRYHIGVDLKAKLGDPVLAPITGYCSNVIGWKGPKTRGVFICGMMGPLPITFLLGAVLPISGLEGRVILAGAKVAEIGVYPAGSSMLHIEAYIGWRSKYERWMKGRMRPLGLVNPKPLLALMMER